MHNKEIMVDQERLHPHKENPTSLQANTTNSQVARKKKYPSMGIELDARVSYCYS